MTADIYTKTQHENNTITVPALFVYGSGCRIFNILMVQLNTTCTDMLQMLITKTNNIEEQIREKANKDDLEAVLARLEVLEADSGSR